MPGTHSPASFASVTVSVISPRQRQRFCGGGHGRLCSTEALEMANSRNCHNYIFPWHVTLQATVILKTKRRPEEWARYLRPTRRDRSGPAQHVFLIGVEGGIKAFAAVHSLCRHRDDSRNLAAW